MTLSIWAFYLFIIWFEKIAEENKNNAFLWVGMTLLTLLSGLTKLQYLAIGFPIAVYFFINRPSAKKITTYIFAGLYGFITTTLSLLWYFRASRIIENSGLTDYGLEFRPEKNLSKGIEILSKNIFSWLPETILNYSAFVLFLAGIYFLFKNKPWGNRWFYPFLVYGLVLIAYHIIELRQMEHHDYYMMPYYIILLAMVGYGGYGLIQKKLSFIVAALLVLQPIFASIRILPARWLKEDKSLSPELFESDSRKELINAIPDGKLAVVGPDESNCILFYFLEKKGFGFSSVESLLQKTNEGTTVLDDYISRGGHYLYFKQVNGETINEIDPYIDSIIIKKGRITVAKLKSK